MGRSILVLVLVAVLATVPVAGAVVGGSSGTGSALHDAQVANESSDVTPGEQLSGVVGVQGAELEGEVDARAAGLAIARADTQAAKASVVANQLGTVQERLDHLEQRKAALQAAHENGSLSDGAYTARMAELVARTEALQRLTNQTATASARLPVELLADRGVNVTAIKTLSDRAGELTGHGVSKAAKSIAGPSVGAGPAGNVGPPNVTVGPDGTVTIGETGDGVLPGGDDSTGDDGTGDNETSDGGIVDSTVTPTDDNVTDDNLTDDNITDDNLTDTNLTDDNETLVGSL